MPGEVKLNPCPFCGGKASIVALSDKWLVPQCERCEIGCSDARMTNDERITAWNLRTPEPGTLEVMQELIKKLEDIQNRGSYLSLSSCLHILKEAERLLRENRREGATSVIRWTRYDGTPETMPEEIKDLLIKFPSGRIREGVARRLSDGRYEWCCGFSQFVNVGDIWAYLPEPPEGME